ncbi:MAG: threonine--tRNA ligase [Proteobacteria bacterium]|nr:threonine--tRNA ligase [Pseudomonadota bacterium]
MKVQLKDGSTREYEGAVSGLDVAKSISPRLAKDAVVVKVNNELWDLTRTLPDNCTLDIVTRGTPEGLDVIRHDAAHVLAEAIKEIYPSAQITIGPSIENGFYYDILCEKSLSSDDLADLEKKMHEIVKRNQPFIREEWARDDAIQFFKSIGEYFKAEIIEGIPEGQTITLYRQGNFVDLCRGPHLPSTGFIGNGFKLMKLAGAYWRGDHNNPMLQRIYGTAWANEADLKAYLTQLEEAEKRDHRKIGQELGLFHLQEEATGSVFWHPKGWRIYRKLQNYIQKRVDDNGYLEVKTPQMVDKSLWEKTGHWENFRENMFTVQDEEKTYAIKPMNCPCHVQIYKQGIKSYRDLPLRLAEFGSCHRNESSGSLHGIMRVRAFTQDDGHIFCTPDQIVTETKQFCDLLKSIYKDLGFEGIRVKFSDRPEKRSGSDAVWDKAENALKEAAVKAGLDCTLNPGEGAFYGPKLEFVLKDAIGREWQCGTLQVDFTMPERLDALYVAEDGKRHHPVMLHRAILGTFERFIGVLIEDCAGNFPFWLAPVQVVVASVTTEANIYAKKLYDSLIANGIYAELDDRNEKISYKVREHSVQKIPYILAIGKREEENNTVSVRKFGSMDQTTENFDEFLNRVKEDAKGPLR